MTHPNSFNARAALSANGTDYTYFSLPQAEAAGLSGTSRLPYCLKVLLENVLRHEDGETVTTETAEAFKTWVDNAGNPAEISFFPTRIMVHDVSGIPLLTDLAAMREHMQAMGKDPSLVNPVRPLDYVTDHSVIVNVAGQADALTRNMAAEFEQNAERYRVAKWAQKAFRNLRVLPPGQGICHQINLERLARVVWSEDDPELGPVAFPDSLLACDSHTPMINALAVLGWGVGAIEALSATLGEPVSMLIPDVVGVRLTGRMREGTTTTDLVLSLTKALRDYGVVQKFVEFTGPALDILSLPERATLSNMAPEYGASVAFFPIDEKALAYLELTGRGDQVPLVEAYAKAQGMWRDDRAEVVYSDVIEFDLDQVEACLAGPKLPQSRVPLSTAPQSAEAAIRENGGDPAAEPADGPIHDGDLAIAAITSCTNTSNPSVMIAAGLLAKNARAKGLTAKPWIKTSLSPGSRAVGDYLTRAGLIEPLEELGFHIAGYGCMTCCGGSGGLRDDIAQAIKADNLSVAAVLSGNRNFEGRVHPQVKLNYLGSPPLVVAYAILGTVLKDITTAPLGDDADGNPVYLADIWPSAQDVEAAIRDNITQGLYLDRLSRPEDANPMWDDIDPGDAGAFDWDDDSTYIVKPPYLETARRQVPFPGVEGAAILAMLGDNVTTDHISPGSRIQEGSLAGDHLSAQGVAPADYSGFLQRRANHEIILRGAFNNPYVQNEMTPDRRGGWTRYQPTGEETTIFDAAGRYAAEGRPAVVVAGTGYGIGSSRDGAARGPHLLGVRAIIAEDVERIHRSNLIGMGIMPLQFPAGTTRKTLGLDGTETVDITGFGGTITPGQTAQVRFTKPDGTVIETDVLCRLDTAREVAWFENGGGMPYVLEKFRGANAA